MAKFDKIAVLNKIGSTGMVPVFYHKDAEVAKKGSESLLRRWCSCIRIYQSW